MTATLTSTLCFNFMVVGQARSGTAPLSSSLCGLPHTHVHVGLFDRDPAVREHAYRSYFEPAEDDIDADAPPWFTPGVTNPYHHLMSQVFDQPRRGECRIGARLSYGFVREYQLHDTIEELHRRGDFCVVHVKRNPVACFVSLKQAEKTGVWGRFANSTDPGTTPMSARIDPRELTAFVREHFVDELRIKNHCPDAIVVQYRDLCLDYEHQVRRVAAYVEAPCPQVALPCVKRMRNRCVRDRIFNFDEILKEVPSDVRAAMLARDLY